MEQGIEQTGMYVVRVFGNTSAGHDPQPLTRSFTPLLASHTPGEGRSASRWAKSGAPSVLVQRQPFLYTKQSNLPLTLLSRSCLQPSLPPQILQSPLYCLHPPPFPSASFSFSPCCHPCPASNLDFSYSYPPSSPLLLVVVVAVVGSRVMAGASEFAGLESLHTIL